MPLCQTMQGLASEELLGDLALERDAVGSMLSCHGLSSENPAPRSIPQAPLTAISAAQPNALWVGIIALIVLIIMGFNLVCLLSADRIIKAIGPSGLQIIAKVAGVLLTALAVQLMILGFRDLGLIDAARVH